MDVDNIPYIYYFLLLDMDKESVIHMILFRSLLTLSYQLIYNCHIVLLLHHVCWTVTPRDMSHDRPSVAMTTENLIHILSVMLNWCIVKRHSITLSLSAQKVTYSFIPKLVIWLFVCKCPKKSDLSLSCSAVTICTITALCTVSGLFLHLPTTLYFRYSRQFNIMIVSVPKL